MALDAETTLACSHSQWYLTQPTTSSLVRLSLCGVYSLSLDRTGIVDIMPLAYLSTSLPSAQHVVPCITLAHGSTMPALFQT